MKNFEKHFDKISINLYLPCKLKANMLGRDVDELCSDTTCTECKKRMNEWLLKEYVPGVDWSKVKVDTPVLVSNNGNDWYEAHFASYKENEVYVWTNGKTSWSASDDVIKMRAWKQAKLAESEDE